MTVPFIDIKRFEPEFLDSWHEKVKKASETASFIGGAAVQTLENTLTEWTKTNFAITCANGTDAIQMALRAVGVEPNDVVLIPNSTFWATFEAVVNVGAKPAVIDVDLTDGGVDFMAFQKAVEVVKPKAAVIAHLYGWATARLEEIRQFCHQKGVFLIEDGAQCFGVQYKGESIYKNAYISTTSFYPAKVLGAAGDGGAVFTNDKDLADKVRMYGNHGRSGHYSHAEVGWNSRLDSLQAIFLNLSISKLQERIASRVESARFYDDFLSRAGIQQIKAPQQYTENGYCNVCLIEKDTRIKIQQKLTASGIGFGNIYPSAMSLQHCSDKYLHSKHGGDNATILGDRVLNLPLFPYMTTDELTYVKEVFLSAI